MHTIKDYDQAVYEKAVEPTYTFGDYVKFYATFVYRLTQPKNIGGQLALVTGGGNGLGREIALRLAKEGCNIVIVDLDLRGAQNTAKEIEEKCKVTALAYKVDVSDYEAVERLKVDIEKTIGFVDILVNNAGILSFQYLRDLKPQEIQKIINVNLTANVWTCKVFMDGMIERKRGHILAISSFCGKFPVPLGNVYGATKAAVENFMEALHDELCIDDHDEYVRCTTVYPTFINTSQNLANFLDVFGVSFGRRFTAEFIADETVNAMLANKRNKNIPGSSSFLIGLLITPDRVMKFTKRNIFPVKTFFESKKT